MQQKHLSISTIIKNTLCLITALFIMVTLPTGWLYDLRTGVGTEQGQKPDENVHQLQCQEDIETFFYTQTPTTVKGNNLVYCPLARLRDTNQKGIHYYRVRHARRQTYISEYITTNYPVTYWQKTLQKILTSGIYNRYYLIELSDNYWICIYFDDYLTLLGANRYTTGYIRYTTSNERSMLNEMSQDYNVNTVYMLDMYQHGKVNWIFDIFLRFVILVVVIIVALTIQDLLKKIKNNYKIN